MIKSGYDCRRRWRREFNRMSQVIPFSMFAKGQFLNAHTRMCGCVFHPFFQIELIKKWRQLALRFCSRFVSHQVYFCSIYGQWSHLCSVTVKTLYQPGTKTVCSTSIPRQNKQFFLSFHFSPHSSISVIALFPGIERSCHNLSRSLWLNSPSGDPSDSLVKLFTPQLCSPYFFYLPQNRHKELLLDFLNRQLICKYI